MKVLFIDESRAELETTRALVQAHHLDIAAHFSTPSQVDEAMQSFRFDIVVFGLSTPEVGMVEKARQLEGAHPAPARLVMSDVAEAARLVGGHLYLPRRVQPDVLRRALLAAMRWNDRLGMARLADIAVGADRLPTIPDVYAELRRELQLPEPSVERVGKLIRADPAITIRLLTLVNSSLYGLRAEVGDVAQAVALLGLPTVSSLVLAAGVYEQAQALDQQYIRVMWAESLRVAWMAKAIARDAGLSRSDVETASFGGLLHDLGDIVFLSNWPREFLAIQPGDRDAQEIAAFGATHADVGAYLTTLWMLPDDVVETIAHHHSPSASRWAAVVSPATAVHVARAFVDSRGDVETAPLDLIHVGQVGVEQVERWFDKAKQALGSP